MSKNKVLVFVLVLFFSTNALAVMNAKCEGNVLVYYDRNNNVVKQDCSILHTGQGLTYRGVCKQFNDNHDADCWRTEGAVTPEYRDAVRGYKVNDSSSWGPAYTPTSTTTTTTIPAVVQAVQCPVCQVCVACEDSSLRTKLYALNSTVEFYKKNADAYRAEADSRIDRVTYASALKEKDGIINASVESAAQCMKDKADAESWNSTYLGICAVSVFVVVIVVFIWVKFEFLGSRFEDPFAEPKKKR